MTGTAQRRCMHASMQRQPLLQALHASQTERCKTAAEAVPLFLPWKGVHIHACKAASECAHWEVRTLGIPEPSHTNAYHVAVGWHALFRPRSCWDFQVCAPPLQAVIQGAVHANGHSPGGNMGGKLGSLAGRQMALFAQIRGSNYDEVAAQVLAQVRAFPACPASTHPSPQGCRV